MITHFISTRMRGCNLIFGEYSTIFTSPLANNCNCVCHQLHTISNINSMQIVVLLLQNCCSHLYYTLHRHLHRDYSSLFPILCAHIVLRSSHLLYTVRHPSRSVLFLPLKLQTCLLPQLLQTRADGKLRWRLSSPSCHHILFPRCYIVKHFHSAFGCHITRITRTHQSNCRIKEPY